MPAVEGLGLAEKGILGSTAALEPIWMPKFQPTGHFFLILLVYGIGPGKKWHFSYAPTPTHLLNVTVMAALATTHWTHQRPENILAALSLLLGLVTTCPVL